MGVTCGAGVGRRYANGDVYEGEWQNGKKHGRGTYTHADGKVEVGEWMAGSARHASGEGVDGKYEGERNAAGQREGYGKMSYATGGVYEGAWKQSPASRNCLQ